MIESIKKFLKKIFNIKQIEKLPEQTAKINNETKNIKDEIKIENNIELLKIQKDYENGTIIDKKLSKEQVVKLINLYEEQLKELDYKILACNNKI